MGIGLGVGHVIRFDGNGVGWQWGGVDGKGGGGGGWQDGGVNGTGEGHHAGGGVPATGIGAEVGDMGVTGGIIKDTVVGVVHDDGTRGEELNVGDGGGPGDVVGVVSAVA